MSVKIQYTPNKDFEKPKWFVKIKYHETNEIQYFWVCFYDYFSIEYADKEKITLIFTMQRDGKRVSYWDRRLATFYIGNRKQAHFVYDDMQKSEHGYTELYEFDQIYRTLDIWRELEKQEIKLILSKEAEKQIMEYDGLFSDNDNNSFSDLGGYQSDIEPELDLGDLEV